MLKYFIQKFATNGALEQQRTGIGRLAGALGFLSNALLFLGKFTIGVAASSVSIMADAINSLTDTVSSILTLVGFQIASKPADNEHPYGHERFEYISGFVISLVITFVGGQFLLSSFKKILAPQHVRLSIFVYVILIVSILIKIWQSRMYYTLGKKIQSTTLKASGQDALNDVLMTTAVLISAIIEGLTNWRVDGVIGFLIACYILYSGISMVRAFINELMGSRPTQEDLSAMETRLNAYPEIYGYHDLLVHNYGPQKTFASVHIEVDDRWSLNQAHEVINKIEKDFSKSLAVQLVCHLDPVALRDDVYQEKRAIVTSIVTGVAEGLMMHDFRVNGPEQMSFDVVVPKECPLTDEELTQTIHFKIQQRLGHQKIEITFDHTYLLQ